MHCAPTTIVATTAVVASLATPGIAGIPWFDSSSRSYHTGDQVISEAYRPAGLDVADLNGDGRPDVVLAHAGNFIAPKFSVQLNDGAGGLGAPITFAVSAETESVVAADFDGDGDVDVALTEDSGAFGNGRLFVFPNNGNGTFGAQRITTIAGDPQCPVAADLDGDGDIDLAIPHQAPEVLSILTNNGAGFFSPATIAFPGGDPSAVDAGDIDGDGAIDLALSKADASGSAAILTNDGAGGFLPPTFLAGTFSGTSVVIADLDADGQQDLVVSTQWLRNVDGVSFAPAAQLPTLTLYTYFLDAVVADFNGDGDLDVAGARYYDYDAGWMLIESNGAGGFAGATQYRSGEYAQGIEAADMDADGDLDVLVVNHGSLTVTVHENDAGTFRVPPVSTQGSGLTLGMDAADLDLDGDLDVVDGDYLLYRHMNNGDGTFTSHEFNPVLGRKYRFKLDDINGDQYPDLLFIRHPDTPPYNFYWALNNGDGSFGAGNVLPLNSCGTGDIDTLDWDADGDPDVVITDHLGCPSQEGVKLILVENNGDGTFEPPVKIINFLSIDPLRVITGDFDGDGHQDIVGTLSERIAFWRGNGDGTFQDQVMSDIDPSSTNERTPWHITADDFDGDGVLDIATSNGGWTFRGENVTVLRGNGDGTFTATGLHYLMFSVWLAGVGGIDTLDADGDGDRDIVASAVYGCDIVLLLNDGNGTFEIDSRYGLDGNPFDIVAGDFDGDGAEDVAAHINVHFDGGVTFLRGLGGGAVTGDANGDGIVNFADILAIVGAWGPCAGACPADLDGDGVVGFADILVAIANWS
jgi:hypothetical protein